MLVRQLQQCMAEQSAAHERLVQTSRIGTVFLFTPEPQREAAT